MDSDWLPHLPSPPDSPAAIQPQSDPFNPAPRPRQARARHANTPQTLRNIPCSSHLRATPAPREAHENTRFSHGRHTKTRFVATLRTRKTTFPPRSRHKTPHFHRPPNPRNPTCPSRSRQDKHHHFVNRRSVAKSLKPPPQSTHLRRTPHTLQATQIPHKTQTPPIAKAPRISQTRLETTKPKAKTHPPPGIFHSAFVISHRPSAAAVLHLTFGRTDPIIPVLNQTIDLLPVGHALGPPAGFCFLGTPYRGAANAR